MKIALLGGNGYQYAFGPSYAQANGRGYITRRELMGADLSASERQLTQVEAVELVRQLRANGQPVPDEIAAIAAGSERGPLDYITSWVGDITGAIGDITSAKSDSTQQGGATAPPRDNTALVVTGAVAGVALLAVAMKSKKRRRR